MKLEGRVCIVTGGAKGMGGAISAALAREGAHVVIAGRDREALQAHAGRIRAAFPERQVLPVRVDVTDEASVQAMARTCVDAFGRIDVLVTAHGVIGPIETPLHEISSEDWHYVLNSNLYGVFLCCKAVVPVMMAQRYGKIINVGGTSGLRGYRYRAAYSSSKWAIRGLTRTLALEVGPHNVNVNVLVPGVVEGDRMTIIVREKARKQGRAAGEVYEEYVREMALRRFSTSEDIAAAAVFLASDDSRQITGQEIVVDGGWDV
ncbi:MAG: SDR family NAD(P)-dependent oxidoreductase [Armatimonadota bacterium]|nr:SDR family NAD(P)-dependent oxidoreductase [Armatimonadota bacterium]MDR5696397.1 SDR family NAD(P)-dependent oxidoreductase [Armatimonadota bacterium]